MRVEHWSMLLLTVIAAACRGPAPPAAAPPAKVENPRKEGDLTTVILSESAEKRLGVKVAVVERRRLDRARTVGGEVTVPKGRSLVVSAPVAGTIVGAGSGIAAGAAVRRGQVVLRLLALPPSGDLSAGAVRLEAARKRAERASKLLEVGAGSQRAVDEARTEVDLAEAGMAAARPRFGGRGGTGALQIEAPWAGVLRELLVAPGQSVAAGAALFHVDSVDDVWVRVPIYVGEMGSVDRERPALVRALSDAAGAKGREALPAAAAPSADPQAATSDLVYQLRNEDRVFRPGQKVEVSVPLVGGQEERLVVPWSAVVHDIHGGAWVYEAGAPHVFTRRRVEVAHVSGPWAVLGRGPAAGARVVIEGVAEIFGTEFGPGK